MLEPYQGIVPSSASVVARSSQQATTKSVKDLLQKKKRALSDDFAATAQLEDIEAFVLELEKYEDFPGNAELLNQVHDAVQKLSKNSSKNDPIFQELRNRLAVVFVGIRAKKVEKIAQGATKNIFVRGEGKEARHVFFVARGGRFGKISRIGNTREMRAELAQARMIRKKKPGAVAYLAIDVEEASEEERIKGKYTLRSQKATGDLGKLLSDPIKRPSSKQTVSYGSQFLHGMADMHEVGVVHGDIKPENLLTYEDGTVKVSDFGKTRVLREGEDRVYVGNAAHSPPEGRLSHKGEVYGAGILLIRCLEAPFGQDPLIAPEEGKKPRVREERRGVERFLLTDKRCIQVDRTTLRGKFTAFTRSFRTSINRPTADDLKPGEEAIGAYIDALIEQMKKHGADAKAADELGALLKDMTRADPAARVTMREASDRYDPIMARLVVHSGAKSAL